MNTKEQVDIWDSVLDEYESTIGLDKYNPNIFQNEELQKYLCMNRDELEKLTSEDCYQIAYRLSQFAFHIQRTINREIARINWAEETIKECICDEVNNYKGYGYIEKATQAIKHNDKAASLNKIKKYAKQRSDRLYFLSTNIKNLSDILINISKSKGLSPK